jgi:hypothetical protein
VELDFLWEAGSGDPAYNRKSNFKQLLDRSRLLQILLPGPHPRWKGHGSWPVEDDGSALGEYVKWYLSLNDK